jgi:DNA-binding NarL/FixJ family response regulator
LKHSFVYLMGGAMVLQITPVERAVLQLLADGNANMDIANRLRVSVETIDAMLTTLLERMGAASQVEAVADAQRRGLLSTRDAGELAAQ